MEDSDSEDAAIPGSHGLGRLPTFPQTHHLSSHMAATAAARRPPPGTHQPSASPLDNHPRHSQQSDLRHAGYQDNAHGHHRHATDNVLPNAKAVHQSHTADRHRLGDNAGPSGQMFGGMHAGFSRSGNLTGDLTGLNAQMDDRDASGAGPSAVAPVPEPAPAIGKIKLKVRRPVSAASEAYDESWFAEHLDRQPELQAPIQTLPEVFTIYTMRTCFVML